MKRLSYNDEEFIVYSLYSHPGSDKDICILYKYIYIYIEREREREKENAKNFSLFDEKDFFYLPYLYYTHIYWKFGHNCRIEMLKSLQKYLICKSNNDYYQDNADVYFWHVFQKDPYPNVAETASTFSILETSLRICIIPFWNKWLICSGSLFRKTFISLNFLK